MSFLCFSRCAGVIWGSFWENHIFFNLFESFWTFLNFFENTPKHHEITPKHHEITPKYLETAGTTPKWCLNVISVCFEVIRGHSGSFWENHVFSLGPRRSDPHFGTFWNLFEITPKHHEITPKHHEITPKYIETAGITPKWCLNVISVCFEVTRGHLGPFWENRVFSLGPPSLGPTFWHIYVIFACLEMMIFDITPWNPPKEFLDSFLYMKM